MLAVVMGMLMVVKWGSVVMMEVTVMVVLRETLWWGQR